MAHGKGRMGGIAVAALLAACVPSSSEVPCGDLLCAAPKVCAAAAGVCVDPDQLAACEGRAEGDGCDLGGVGAGICRAGVCVVGGCGDGVVDLGEACDDGNDVDDDGCTNACALPTCGDGVAQAGEECDQGAANGDDRACTSRCMVATCGDNLIQAGVEECDAGAANADDDACTSACMRNVCGDGAVFAGVEACDDGNLASGDGCRADCRKVEACGDAAVDAGEACDDGNANPADGCDACVATSWTATVTIGGNLDGAQVDLNQPRGVAVDAAGRVYIGDTINNRVRRVDADGTITTVAGISGYATDGEGVLATSSDLFFPSGLSVDGLGRIFIADSYWHRIRRVDLDGRIFTVAGTSYTQGFAGDGGAATAARLREPLDVVVDGLGRVYIADTGNHRIRRVDEAGVITTIAGTGTAGFLGDGGPATAARLNTPAAIAFDGSGRLVIADAGNQRVRRLELDGTITTIAGTGAVGSSGDGGPATAAKLDNPRGVAVDAAGGILVSMQGANVVRRIAPDGTIARFAGGGAAGGFGDGGPALAAGLTGPERLAVDGQGRVVIADAISGKVRRVDTDGIITTVAGSGAEGFQGDGGGATAGNLSFPVQISRDATGGLLIADQFHHTIRRLAPDGTLATVAGNGSRGAAGYGGPATSAQLSFPTGVTARPDGSFYIADTDNARLHHVDAAGVIHNIAGNGVTGFLGDGGPATMAHLSSPGAVAVDAAGVVYFTDTGNHRIRKIAVDGTISTHAGTGVAGFLGDGGPASAARLSSPQALAFDDAGRLVITDTGNHRLRRIAADGTITTIAGIGASGPLGDGGPATSALVRDPIDVQPDGAGGLLVSQRDGHRLRHITAAGVISTLVGTGVEGDTGDGGPATAALVRWVGGAAVLADGTIAVTDLGNHRIRQIRADGTIHSIAGALDPEGVGPLAQARLAAPSGLARADGFTLVAGGTTGVVEVVRPERGWLEVGVGRYPTTAATGNLARIRPGSFGSVGGVAWDAAAGELYLTEIETHRLYRVAAVDPDDVDTWTIAPLANPSGTEGWRDGTTTLARFRTPTGLHFDPVARVLYVADTGNHVVRAIDVDADVVSTVGGVPATRGFFGDGGAATAALLFEPQAVTRCGDDLFVADTGNNRVRRIDALGIITTVLGDGVATSSGEGTPASTFPADHPRGLACDAVGNLLMTSSSVLRLLPADAAGIVDGSGPVQTIYGAPPRDTFPASVTTCLADVAVIDVHTVEFVDSCDGLLVELSRAPIAP
ncbi:MAG: hypothetical protein R2939_14555 [Kofleriaceae bacterium]